MFQLTRSSGCQGLSVTGMGGRWWVGETEAGASLWKTLFGTRLVGGEDQGKTL